MAQLPTGNVTLLFTDIEGSTERWERDASAMRSALVRHNDVIRAAVERHGGVVFKLVGDAFNAAFASALAALGAAVEAQSDLHAENWGSLPPVRVRMGLHTGLVEAADYDLSDRALNRVSRLLACAHGGQILLSLATQQLVRDEVPHDWELVDLGTHQLRSLQYLEHIFRVRAPGMPDVPDEPRSERIVVPPAASGAPVTAPASEASVAAPAADASVTEPVEPRPRAASEHVFVSYAFDDAAAADQLVSGLEARGVRCWIAPRDVPPGEWWPEAITTAIGSSSAVVLLFSARANASDQVAREIALASGAGVKVIPHSLDGAVPERALAFFLGPVHRGHTAEPLDDSSLGRLAARLRSERPKPPSSACAPQWCPTEPPLVGRTDAMERLRQAWRSVGSGRARTVLVRGDTGVGKTRLVQEFVAEQTGKGARWLGCQAVEGEERVPYATLMGALSCGAEHGMAPDVPAHVLSELSGLLPGFPLRGAAPAPPPAEPDQASARLRLAWHGLLASLCDPGPMILCIDDLQWVDAESLQVLRAFLTWHANTPLLFVGTYRSGGARSNASVRELRSSLRGRDALDELDLAPLTEEETVELVGLATKTAADAVAGALGRQLYAHTEGSPLYALETLKMLVSHGDLSLDASGSWRHSRRLPLPRSAVDLAASQLEGIGATASRLSHAAAVVGREFSPRLAMRVADLEEAEMDESLAELTGRMLVRARGHGFEFGHGLLRETILAAIPPWTRGGLHLKLAALLEPQLSEARSASEVTLLADHYLEGARRQDRCWAEAFEYQLEAGLASLKLSDSRSASVHLGVADEIAEDHLPTVEGAARVACLEGLGDSQHYLGEFDRALELYGRAADLPCGDEAGARIGIKIAEVLDRVDRYREAIDRLDAVATTLRPDDQPYLYSRMCQAYGMVHFRLGQMQTAAAWSERAIALESPRAHLLMAMIERATGETESALSHCERAKALAAGASDLITLQKAHHNGAVILFELGRWSDALHEYERSLEVQAATGEAFMRVLTLCNLSDVHRHLGDLEAAARQAEEALPEARQLQSRFPEALAQLNLGTALLAAGQARVARVDHLVQARDVFESIDVKDHLVEVYCAIGDALLAEGLAEDAEQAAGQALKAARPWCKESDEGSALRVAGLAHLDQGRLPESEAALGRSAELLSEHGPRYELARAYAAQARLLRARGAPAEEVRERVELARAIFVDLGARADLVALERFGEA